MILAFCWKMGGIDKLHGGWINGGWSEAQNIVPNWRWDMDAVSDGTYGARVLLVRTDAW